MKTAILGNQARAMSNFWSVLLRQARARGHDVLCLIPVAGADDDPVWEQKLAACGVRLVRYRLDRRGLNPLRDLLTLLDLQRIFRREKPDALFACAVKPVVYGAFASALAGFPRKNRRSFMITGLGYLFEGDTPAKRLLMQLARLLYRCAFTAAGKVFFQNVDDRARFEELGIVPAPGAAGSRHPGRTTPAAGGQSPAGGGPPAADAGRNPHASLPAVLMCKGTGVDTEHFAFRPPCAGPPVFLYIGRLAAAKGVREFMEAARLTRAAHPEAVFRIVGPAETGPGSVPLSEVLAARDAGHIEYLGEQPDVRPCLEQARAVLLPSYREGVPVSLMEALSVGRAVIAADAPGSREVAVDGLTGFLVPPGDARALADAAIRLLRDPELAARMGRAGRTLMETEYDARVTAEYLLDAIGAQD
ncbi:MAG: glycosyltransferase family 4 protein [Desulfovibrio sp.]|jgi:glycosyltransferase involved in cell wall biosynthesis|nr:glycosyltransferase family 4 protein [Desulfovibrio sp.]